MRHVWIHDWRGQRSVALSLHVIRAIDTCHFAASLGVIINHAHKSFPAEKLVPGQAHYPGLFADHSPPAEANNPFDAVGPTASAQEQESNANEEGVKSDDNDEGDEGADDENPRDNENILDESPRDIIEGVSNVHVSNNN